ncbi:MAG: CheR family methyltransferase [Maritimibacter sp.]
MTFQDPSLPKTEAPAASAQPQSRANGPALSEAAFECIAALAKREAGLAIASAKAAMVRTRLSRRLRLLNLRSFEAYCDHVQSPEGKEELGEMISALTTNVSHFFREDHHFQTLRNDVLPPLIANLSKGKRLRIWSAGCSNGQEPMSIAMTLREANVPADADVKILATDIDPVVVAHAKRGFYSEQMISGLDKARRNRFFTAQNKDGVSGWQANDDLKSLISVRQLNLLRDWPMKGTFDVIFCRNVVIYFDAETQTRLWQRFAKVLAPEAWMFLGHSERVCEENMTHFRNSGVTTYRRTEIPTQSLRS